LSHELVVGPLVELSLNSVGHGRQFKEWLEIIVKGVHLWVHSHWLLEDFFSLVELLLSVECVLDLFFQGVCFSRELLCLAKITESLDLLKLGLILLDILGELLLLFLEVLYEELVLIVHHGLSVCELHLNNEWHCLHVPEIIDIFLLVNVGEIFKHKVMLVNFLQGISVFVNHGWSAGDMGLSLNKLPLIKWVMHE
jgi:hypothetical protein